ARTPQFERGRTHPVWRDDYLGLGGLGDVARTEVVFEHLRCALRDRAGPHRLVVCGHRHVASTRTATAARGSRAPAFARLRQPDVGFPDGLGIFVVSQLLLIWSGNLPEEVAYYQRRSQGGWEYVAGALALFQFAVPFVLLLSGQIKRERMSLLRVAVLILVMRMVDLFWMVVPAPQPGSDGHAEIHFQFSWTDVVAPV